jgi:hypothetical protein
MCGRAVWMIYHSPSISGGGGLCVRRILSAKHCQKFVREWGTRCQAISPRTGGLRSVARLTLRTPRPGPSPTARQRGRRAPTSGHTRPIQKILPHAAFERRSLLALAKWHRRYSENGGQQNQTRFGCRDRAPAHALLHQGLFQGRQGRMWAASRPEAVAEPRKSAS